MRVISARGCALKYILITNTCPGIKGRDQVPRSHKLMSGSPSNAERVSFHWKLCWTLCMEMLRFQNLVEDTITAERDSI